MNNDSTKFLLEEYKNIASTHDKLRDIISRFFNYFLVISALPFTLSSIIVRIQTTNGIPAPNHTDSYSFIPWFFIVVSVGNAYIALSMLEARYSQYRYAKSVNLIRKYFVDNNKKIKDYLYLPISKNIPEYGKPGFVGYQIAFILILSFIYFLYGISNVQTTICNKINGSLLFIICYGVLFFRLHRRYASNKDFKTTKK